MLKLAQRNGRHQHVTLEGGKTKKCEEHPRKFCELVCEGIRKEMEDEKWLDVVYRKIDVTNAIEELMRVQERHENQEMVTSSLDKHAVPPDEESDLWWYRQLYQDVEFEDDVRGGKLDKELMIKARRAEIQFFNKLGVYTKVKREAHMKIITTKWVDTNKGDNDNPNYRARLVGRELALQKRNDIFAATPPLEALRLMISLVASRQDSRDRNKNYILMTNDVTSA